jgi:hypothetical protein
MRCFRRLILCQTFPKKNKQGLLLKWPKGVGGGGGMGQKGRLIRENKEQKQSNKRGYDGLCTSSGGVTLLFPNLRHKLDVTQFRAVDKLTANRTRTVLQNLLLYGMSSGRNCVVCIANPYALDVTGFEPRWGKIFRTQPDLLRGPPSLCAMASGSLSWLQSGRSF